MFQQLVKPEKKHRLCVVTPIHKDTLSDEEWLSVRACQKHLSQYDCFIIAPNKLQNGNLHTQLKGKYRWLWFDDANFESIAAYNHLLLSHTFYEIFEAYTFMLVYQTDALIFNDKIDEWLDMDYSYIGAPWLNNLEERMRSGSLFKGVGNGGFSLRKISHIIRVLKSSKKLYSLTHYIFNFYEQKGFWNYLKYLHSYIFLIERFNTAKYTVSYNEDKIIACGASRFGFFLVPPAEEALRFAFEENPSLLYNLNKNQLPLGCHAWQKNDPIFYSAILTKSTIL